VIARAREKLLDAIVAGDETSSRRVVLDLYAAGHPLAAICDSVIASVFCEIGNLWECGNVDVYQERHSCEIASRIMHDLDLVISPPKPGAPLAIGGSLSGDHYTIASAMVEVILRSLGWRVQRIGSNLPFESMLNSIRDRKPRLFWLSVSFIGDVKQFIAEYNEFFESRDTSTAVVLGGQAITGEIREQIAFSGFCDNMRQLVEFATAISAPKQIPEGNN
jgi:methanogenic corrinoid protein MtbC1